MPFGTSGCTHSFAFSTINNESGTVVPLPTSAACAPRRPSHATASLLQSLSQDSRVWRAVTTTVVGLVPQGQGYRVTKGYPSEVRSMVKHFVTLFRSTKALGWGVLCVCRRILSCGGGGAGGAPHIPSQAHNGPELEAWTKMIRTCFGPQNAGDHTLVHLQSARRGDRLVLDKRSGPHFVPVNYVNPGFLSRHWISL